MSYIIRECESGRPFGCPRATRREVDETVELWRSWGIDCQRELDRDPAQWRSKRRGSVARSTFETHLR